LKQPYLSMSPGILKLAILRKVVELY
jgi:hypothetical protein